MTGTAERMDKKKTTSIGLTDIHEDNDRYLSKLEEYPYLKEENMTHRREQLFLMIQSGASDEFIDRFIDDDVNCSIADLDIIRSASFLIGEDFLMEKVAGRTLTPDELKKEMVENLISMSLPVLKELEENEEQFRKNLITCSVLAKKLKDDREWVSKVERERYDHLLAEKSKAFKEKEDALEAKIREVTKMTEMTEMTEHQQDFQNDGKQEKGSCEEEEERSWLQSFHQWHLNRILAFMMKKNNYTPAQMECILRIMHLSPTTGQFRRACDPKVRVENLMALETYIIARKGQC